MAQSQLHRLFSEASLETPTKSFLSHEDSENDISTNTSGLGRHFDEKSVLFKTTKIALLKSAISELESKIHRLRLENRDIVTSEGRAKVDIDESRKEIGTYLRSIQSLRENYSYYNGYLSEKRMTLADDIQARNETLAGLESAMYMKSLEFSKVKKNGHKKGIMSTLKRMWN